ncbi:hypothetical protein JXA80_06505 [bacterium]|nr:hypothetical protein [candidate division CSSED10-310 bacterium]
MKGWVVVRAGKVRVIDVVLVLVSMWGCGSGDADRNLVKARIPTQVERVVSVAVEVPSVVPEKVKVYPFKSGRFTFSIQGMGVREGTMELIIDEYGHWESKRSEKTLDDGSHVTIWSIKRGLELYSIDVRDREIIRARMQERQPAGIAMDQLIAQHGGEDAARRYLEANRIELLADEAIHGYSCQVVRKGTAESGITRWVYQGVELRMAVSRSGQDPVITRDLVSLELNVDVNPSAFEVPTDFYMQDAVLSSEN